MGPMPRGRPFDGMTDEQVLARAAEHLQKVQLAEPGSVVRSIQWGLYEQAKAELDVRLYAYIFAKLKDRS